MSKIHHVSYHLNSKKKNSKSGLFVVGRPARQRLMRRGRLRGRWNALCEGYLRCEGQVRNCTTTASENSRAAKVLAQNGFNGCAGIPTKGLLTSSSATPRVTRVWEKTKIQEKIGKMPKNARFSKKKSSEPTPCAPGVIKVSLESPLKGLPLV